MGLATKKRLLNLKEDLIYEAYLRVWRTRDGRLIPLRELDDKHLNNIIAMLDREYKVSKLAFYMYGPLPNGEMAQMALEQEMDRALADVPLKAHLLLPRMATLKMELERRKVDNESVTKRIAEKLKDRAAVVALAIHHRGKHDLQRVRHHRSKR